ncbi:hypothetical protein ACIBHX_23160 [Nonomuraea sp. NPDC050536]|uniref:hypothetical protein n=1 Tax=Nonomuraea sp. NPDC050536 TaxID=3364366 RepID=UPI0037C92B63
MPLMPDGELGETVTGLLRRPVALPFGGDGAAHDRAAPPLPANAVALEEVLAGRRSVREFDARRPALADLLGVLELAETSQRRQRPAGLGGAADLRTAVAAYGIDGLPAGLYVRDHASGELRRAGEAPWLEELRDSYAHAPTLVLICCPAGCFGADTYGQLLVRAGALGYAVWLAARTYGLDCSVYGKANRHLAGTFMQDGIAMRHLFTIAVGYSTPQPPPAP